MEDAKMQLLYDHYKDTFFYIQEYLKFRDRLFLFILIVVTLMLFQVYSPAESGEAVSQFITKKLELKSPIDITFIGSIIWFGLLSLVVRYFQTVVHIERQYKYVHQIEEQLSIHYENKAFTREGKSYLEDYPLFSSWAWILYTIVFPTLLIVLVIVKIVGEIWQTGSISLLISVNVAIALFIVLSTLFYLLLVHPRLLTWMREKINKRKIRN